MVNQYGIDTIDNFNDDDKKVVIEAEWSDINGQSSGVT